MKKQILIILMSLFTVTVFGQYSLQKHVIDTTRSDGQRFIFTWPVRNVVFNFKDSIKNSNTSPQWSVTYMGGSTATLVTNYISMQNSEVTYVMKINRIVMGDTLTNYITITEPLAKLRSKPANIFEGIEMSRIAIINCKAYAIRRLNQN